MVHHEKEKPVHSLAERDDVMPCEPPLGPIPWPEFRKEFEGLYSPALAACATRAKMRQVLNELEALGIASTADLAVPLVTRYIESRPPGQSPWTLHGMLASLRAICSYAERAGYLRISPFRLRKLSRWVRLTPLEGRRHCSRDDIRRLLELLARDVETLEGWAQWRARRLQTVVAIIAYCGLRKMEALRLRVADVDLVNRIIHVRPAPGARLKTATSQAPVPIPAALVPILTNWAAHRMDAPYGYPLPDDCPWLIPTNNRKSPWISGQKGGKALDRLQAVAGRADIEGVTFQALRRSTATHLESHGCPPALIARVLRHSVRVDERFYRQADLSNMAKAVDGFDF
jgi:integrase